ncbi:MAG: TIR domain-containing protein [Clostridiales bacterium]|nr:TIR domain-containing protein [Clostridiales bacterium]
MKKTVFISYASKELKKANEVCSYLEKEGISCWIAPRDILPGTEFGEAIINGIEDSSTFVLIYSEASNGSQHVLREVERAVSKNVPIIAYKIEDAHLSKSMEYFLLSNQWLDATGKGDHLAELLSSVKKLVGENKNTKQEIVNYNKKADRILSRWIPTACSIVAVIGLIVFLGFALNGKNQQDPEIAQTQPTIVADENVTNSIEPTTVVKEETANSIEPTTVAKEDVTIGIEPTIVAKEEGTDSVLPTQITVEGKQEVIAEEKKNQNTTTQSEKLVQEDHIKQSNNKKEDAPNTEVQNGSDDLGTEQTVNPASQEVENSNVNLEVGQYIKYGKYKPQGYKGSSEDSIITWLIINVDQNKKQVTLLAKNVLDMKPFDCAESGEFDKLLDGQKYDRTQRESYSLDEMMQFRGSNDWKTSNIRTWLNSNKASVTYNGQAPVNKGTDMHINGYDKQPGFLYNFTKDELSLLCEVSNTTASNAIAAQKSKKPAFEFEAGYITDDYDSSKYVCNTTEDKVYLLSVDEVKKFLYDQGLPIYAEPTQAAIDAGKSEYYTNGLQYDVTASIWALRTPNGADSYRVLGVERGISGARDIFTYLASACGLGIRPAVTISIDKISVDGDGSEDNPYTIK